MDNQTTHPLVPQSHRPFTLVLGGGAARGFSHVGVLRGLEAYGFRPSAIVGVSMGSVVGVTYALRSDWYEALLEMNTSSFPKPLESHDDKKSGLIDKMQTSLAYTRAAKDLFLDWGIGIHALEDGKTLLKELTQDRNLEDTHIPVAVSTTDLISGDRHVMRTGKAAKALYASSALAGILPPFVQDDLLLADGAYTDIAPIDVARTFTPPVVIAVDPGQDLISPDIQNGYQALMRAMEICHLRHADMRFSQADLVIRPRFERTIDTLDFEARRECVYAGLSEVREQRNELGHLLKIK